MILIKLFDLIFGKKPKTEEPRDDKQAYVQLELGTLQIYSVQTREELQKNIPYKELFWRDKKSPYEIFGPFPSIYHACNHYEWLKAQPKIKDNVVRIDFRTKKRI
jgi:hypothetical protein